ncbi:MAG: hypothetical protein M1832_000049 [Thelocarpon impressellum]|nr:MAG: hypothetical protein M1832_000049 [Thelocarpon impressellum]
MDQTLPDIDRFASGLIVAGQEAARFPNLPLVNNAQVLGQILVELLAVREAVTTLSTRVDSISTRVDSISTRLDSLSTQVDVLSTRVDNLSTRVDCLSTRVDSLSTRVDSLSMRIDHIDVSLHAHTANTIARVFNSHVSSRDSRLEPLLGNANQEVANFPANESELLSLRGPALGVLLRAYGLPLVDEALAVYLLRLLPTYTPSLLLRTRDPALLATCHTVVDVGGEYDPSSHRYDHHQRTFDATFPSRPTKLSSAGLVYLHFGKAIVAQHVQLPEDSEKVRVVWEKLYVDFIEALDANDNGISAYDPAAIARAGLEKRFADGGVTLGALVGDLNPNWNDALPSDPKASQVEEDVKFVQASELMGTAFARKLSYYASAWLPARALVHAAYAERQKHDPKGRIVVFAQGLPWKDHLYALEAANASSPPSEPVLYVLYPESPAPEAKWRIQAVPVSKDSFESRKPLPEAWRGVRDAQLDSATGVDGCVFVHAAGFIGGNRSWDGVKRMADKAVAL